MAATETPKNNVYQLLKKLLGEEDSTQWVSATVLTKYRSSYRKPGAMMLVSPLGQTYGLISGGCLESDIVLRARRVLQYGHPEFVIYDSMEEGNIAAELGLGCNGRIGVLIEEITESQRAIYGLLLERMKSGQTSCLVHAYNEDGESFGDSFGIRALLDENQQVIHIIEGDGDIPQFDAANDDEPQLSCRDGFTWSRCKVKPPVRLLLVGGGVDAQPVAELAARLGWRVTVADHRTVNARHHYFAMAEAIVNVLPEDLEETPQADAVIVMSHNLETDARWLSCCSQISGLEYVGLLGPQSRKEQVLEIAGLDPGGAFAKVIYGRPLFLLSKF